MNYIVFFLVSIGFLNTAFAQYAENEIDFSQEQIFSAEKRIDSIQTFDGIFDLKYPQYVTVTEYPSIAFLKVIDDPMCHNDVICVWKGKIMLKFDIQKYQNREIILRADDNNSVRLFDQLRVQLINTQSYPTGTKTTTLENYVVISKIKDDEITNIASVPPTLSPLKQFKIGISIDKIICNKDLQLISRYDYFPACVKPSSATILLKQGWGYEIKALINSSGKINASLMHVKVYDNMLGPKPFTVYPGMHDIVLLTSNYFWNNTSYYKNWDKIDWKQLQSKLDNIAKTTPIRPIVLDIEGTDNEESGNSHWSVDQRKIGVDFTAEQYYEYKQHWIQIIDFVKNNYPGDVGVYGLAPIRDFFTPVRNISSNLESWHLANSALRDVVEHVDFVVPSLYTFYDEPKYGGNTVDARSKWITYAQKNILEARQYGKPIYTYLSGYFHPSNYLLEGKPIPKEFMMLQYETVINEGVKHIVMWGRSVDVTDSDPLNEPWYQALRDIGLDSVS